MPLRALVINLPAETARLAFQRDQAARLGLELEVVPAVTVADLSPPADDPCWNRWQRPLRAVEMATLMSHRAAWRRVIALGQPVLVLEDDAWLMPGAAALAAQAAALAGIEHLSLETRGRRKLLGATHPQVPGLRRLWLDRTGAAACLLWPEGARKLLARADRVPALADAVPVETPGLLRWQAAPAQAIQIDMAARYGLTPPIAVASAISSVPRPARGSLRHRLRRVARQLWMGLAALRPGTRRIELRPAGAEKGPA
ncbi:glycosyltransferase family 25 protein [Rhodobacter sp. Har01]|uniref:glycosyltransferase family 25 protein n=1 Tax=Rhodobacter sp. Har01 TaxID=2883999 RepID=UPI001D063799|nr:glycosyltransferase family 25 protein [Rhodobacter sp. Har01]MCB6178828.1 glycosyltransferase family 25 protein [Rhodobacter sp. Har01]